MVHQSTRAFKSQSSRSSTAPAERQLYFTPTGQQSFSRTGDVISRNIDAARHILRKPYPRIAFDASAFEQAVEDGARLVCVYLRDEKRTLIAPVDLFLRAGRHEHFANHGPQLSLALALWVDPAEEAEAQRKAAEPVQMGLFAGGAA